MSKTFEDAISALAAVDGGQDLVDAVTSRLSSVNKEAQTLRERAKKAESRLNKIFDVTGVDSTLDDDAIEATFKAAKGKPNSDTEIQKLTKMVNQFAAERDAAIAENRKVDKNSKIQDAISSLKVLPELSTYVKDGLSSKVKHNENGELVFIDNDGTEIDFSEGVKKYITSNPRLIANEQNQGGGTKPPNGGSSNSSKTMKKESFMTLSTEEKIKLSNEGIQLTD